MESVEYCSKCGKQSGIGAKFCTKCGTNIAVDKNVLETQVKDELVGVSNENPDNTVGLILLSGIVLISGLIFVQKGNATMTTWNGIDYEVGVKQMRYGTIAAVMGFIGVVSGFVRKK